MKILIVEDEVIAAMALRRAFVRRGYEVCPLVSSGAEAIVKADLERPDVVLMDIQLQGEVDGIAAGKEIAGRLGIPVAYMTGFPDAEMMEKASAVNPLGYFVKPIDLEDVLMQIQAYMTAQKTDSDD